MIENFETVKGQLRELSEVVNAFKSEAVQLKIIDLILGGGIPGSDSEEKEVTRDRPLRRKHRKSKVGPAAEPGSEETRTRKRRVASGSGAIATLASVYTKGFFKEPRTIGEIVSHCETDLARKIKANEISGRLARMVRNGELSRKKNKDGQYEYQNAKA